MNKKLRTKVSLILSTVMAISLGVNSNINNVYATEQRFDLSDDDKYDFVVPEGIHDVQNDIHKLSSVGNVMFVGAHPDDENNGLLSYLNYGEHVDVSYLDSNWGEGGDNWIGPELYGELGVLRSQELKSSRIFDGAKQLYLGAYDFGYSVSLAESLINRETGENGIWNVDILTYNLARLIRLERPDVIFSHHRSDKTDHGQHIANGYLIEVAMDMAKDDSYIIKDYDGNYLPAWSIKKYYGSWNTSIDGDNSNADLVVETGDYDEVLGYSYSQIGTMGRNMHKCQNMDRPLPEGSAPTYWKLMKAEEGYEQYKSELFGGIDTSINRIEEALTSQYSKLVNDDLNKATNLLEEVQRGYVEGNEKEISGKLLEAKKLFNNMEKTIKKDVKDQNILNDTQVLLNRVYTHIDYTLTNLFGLSIEIIVDDNDVVPGQTFTANVIVSAEKAGARIDANEIRKKKAIAVPEGWKAKTNNSQKREMVTFDDGSIKEAIFEYKITIPEDYKEYTGPFNAPYNEYYTNTNFPHGSSDDINGDGIITYDEINAGITTNGEQPYGTSGVITSVDVFFGEKKNDTTISIQREPNLRVVPKISVSVDNKSEMKKYTGADIEGTVDVIVRNNTKTSIDNLSVTAIPTNIDSRIKIDTQNISILSEDEEVKVTLKVDIPKDFKSATELVVKVNYNGALYDEGFRTIDYGHTQKQNYYTKASQALTIAEFGLPSDDIKIGYYDTGKDTFVMEYIKIMYNDAVKAEENVQVISNTDLQLNSDELLEKYDTIIIGKMGVSANNVINNELVGATSKLMKYVEKGGNLVVHYQNARLEDGKMPLAPKPFYLSGVNINKEDSDVYIIGSENNPIYTGYNKINTEIDENGLSNNKEIWDGWMQQRCEWTVGPRESEVIAAETAYPIEYVTELGYEVLFQGRDPGDSYDRPAILYKKLGEGSYTYSSVVWERQLQSLVPGAFKLYANLISMGYEE